MFASAYLVCNVLKPTLLSVLYTWTIVIPDKDAVEEWARILSTMSDIATFTLSSFCEMGMKDLGAKGDVADYLIKKLKIVDANVLENSALLNKINHF